MSSNRLLLQCFAFAFALLMAPHAAAAAAAVLAVALTTLASPVHAASTTPCGYAPTTEAPCDEQCKVLDPATGFCSTSCGHLCQSDAECGAWPHSPCSACQSGRCTGNAEFGNCTAQYPRTPGMPQAPVLPAAWNATFVMTNYTHFEGDPPSPPSTGFTWYDASVGGLRQDFEAPCPFVELQAPLRNNGTCSVLFYEGYNYYIYPDAGADVADARGPPADAPRVGQAVCCKYHFPGWMPDSYRTSNASFAGVDHIGGVQADHWAFQYSCPWLRPEVPGYAPRLPGGQTVQRDVWTVHGTNTPVQFNETLTSGVSVMQGLEVGPQDTGKVFASFIGGFKCLEAGVDEPTFSRVCNRYNARGRLSYLGYG